MTSAQDFLTAFAKQIVHNVDTRPQIVQQWTEKLETREAEIGRGFYERFEKMAQDIAWDYHKLVVADGKGKTDYIYEQFMEAAKKAAGLEGSDG